MQLYALNSEQKLIFAAHAIKQCDYHCIECNAIVRLRAGLHRHPHYYHLAPNRTCGLSGKSMAHLQVQSHLQQLFPEGECLLEYHFPLIKRIADVAWITKKLLFEVQCSSITAQEVKERQRDYASQGFQLIWILHDRRYNKWKISAAERHLRSFPFYFTNIDEEGRGIIYDQFDLINKGIRKEYLPPLPIELQFPHLINSLQTKICEQNIPQLVAGRRKCWPIYFTGDLIDCCSSAASCLHNASYIEQSLQLELLAEQSDPQSAKTFVSFIKWIIAQGIIRPYALIWQMLLEKSCK